MKRITLLGLVAIAAIAALTAVCILLLVVVPDRLVEGEVLSPKDRLDAENAIRTSILSGIGALFVAGGLVFTARTYVATREGQITDRYTAAVNQLGAQQASAVIGGIYALERIARDSPRDLQTISDVLCAVIREAAYAGPMPASTVVAALEVLSRIPGSDGERRLDLRNAKLDGLRLPRLRLAGADLSHASLAGAQIEGSDLRNCRLDYADFTRASLRHAKMTKVQAVKATFAGAYLDHAEARGAVFDGADFRAASIVDLDAQRSSLRGSDLSNAQLSDSTSGARADLRGSDLTSAAVDHADVRGMDLRETIGLTLVQQAAALTDPATRWPQDLA